MPEVPNRAKAPPAIRQGALIASHETRFAGLSWEAARAHRGGLCPPWSARGLAWLALQVFLPGQSPGKNGSDLSGAFAARGQARLCLHMKRPPAAWQGGLLFDKKRKVGAGIHSAADAVRRQIALLPALTRAGCGRCPGPCRRRSGTAPKGRSPSAPAAPPRGCPARWTRRPSSVCGCPGPGRFACCGSPSWW